MTSWLQLRFWLTLQSPDPAFSSFSSVLCGFATDFSNSLFVPSDPSPPDAVLLESFKQDTSESMIQVGVV